MNNLLLKSAFMLLSIFTFYFTTFAKTIDPPIKNEFADVKASYPGGELEMLTFMNTQVKYTEIARDYNIEGSVIISFVIDQHGNAKDFKVVQGLGYGLDQNVIKALKKMPSWAPAIEKGKVIPVTCNFVFDFNIY